MGATNIKYIQKYAIHGPGLSALDFKDNHFECSDQCLLVV